MDIDVNRFRLNTELLQNSTVQEQFNGANGNFSFPDGMHEMFNTAKLYLLR